MSNREKAVTSPAAGAAERHSNPAWLSPKQALRAGVGGLLMGLANLVPGISGGTMLLASGVYPDFIHAIAECSALRFRARPLAILAIVVTTAGTAILLFAGPVKELVVAHRWLMYSLFIGLTLGGLPVVWRLVERPLRTGTLIGIVAGSACMGLISFFQLQGSSAMASDRGMVFLLFAGVAGAGAMILPGVSGGYLLLVLGVYVPILGAIHALKISLRAGDLAAASGPALSVVLPVGIGVVLGVVFVSRILEWLLQRYAQPTYGVLIGLLAGAVLGLWPFQEGTPPAIGTIFKGQVVTQATLLTLDPDKYPTTFFTPSVGHLAASAAVVVLGFCLTALLAAVGRSAEPAS